MNKASHSSGISLTFTADPFIHWFKSPGLSYLKGIKERRKYTHSHTCTHTHPPTLLLCSIVFLSVCVNRIYIVTKWNSRAQSREAPDCTWNPHMNKNMCLWTSHHSHWYWSCGWPQGWYWKRRLLWLSLCIVPPDWHSPHQPVETTKHTWSQHTHAQMQTLIGNVMLPYSWRSSLSTLSVVFQMYLCLMGFKWDFIQ